VAIVKLEHLSKRFAGAHDHAVDDVSLTVDDGEFMVLLGPSGCGKSTTLRMIAGLESISSGALSIDGKPMNRVLAKDRDIAMVFQTYALYPHMSVRNNLAFGLRRRRVPRDEIESRVTRAAETLGLADLLDRKPYALSGGQRQRVALGRAIVRDPKVFLFDEPLSNLDAGLRVHTRNELIKLHQRLGATMIYVTHDQVEAMTMGNRVCIMDQGRVVQVGHPLEVYLNPSNTFVASFLGSPPTNLVDARIHDGARGTQVEAMGVEFTLGGFAATDLARLPGGRAIFGVRPEDVYIEAPPDGQAGRFAELRAVAVAVEPLGAEVLLVLSVDNGVELIARAGRDVRLRSGETVPIFLDMGAVHLFDPDSTLVLPRGGAPADT